MSDRILLLTILAIAVASLLVSIGKLAMLTSLRQTLCMYHKTTDQYIALTQQYHDLYAREGRDAQQVNLNAAEAVTHAAQAITDTVKVGLSESQSVPVVILTDAEKLVAAKRAIERIDRAKKINGGS